MLSMNIKVPSAIGELSKAISLVGLNTIEVYVLLSGAGYNSEDDVSVYGGVVSNATSITQLRQLGTCGWGQIYKVWKVEFPYLYVVRASGSSQLTISVSGQETTAKAQSKNPTIAAGQIWKSGASSERTVSRVDSDGVWMVGVEYPYDLATMLRFDWACVGIETPYGRVMVGERRQCNDGDHVGVSTVKCVLDNIGVSVLIGDHASGLYYVADRVAKWPLASAGRCAKQSEKGWHGTPGYTETHVEHIRTSIFGNQHQREWKTRKPTPSAGQVWRAGECEKTVEYNDGGWVFLKGAYNSIKASEMTEESTWRCVGVATPIGTVRVGETYQVSPAATATVLAIVERDEVGLGVEIQYRLKYTASSRSETYYCGPSRWDYKDKVQLGTTDATDFRLGPAVSGTRASFLDLAKAISQDRLNRPGTSVFSPAMLSDYAKKHGYPLPEHIPLPIEEGWKVQSFSFGTPDFLKPQAFDCKSLGPALAPHAVYKSNDNSTGGPFTVPYAGKIEIAGGPVMAAPLTTGELKAKAEIRAQACRQIDQLLAKDAATFPRFARARKYAVMAKMEAIRPPCLPSDKEVACRLLRLHEYQALLDKGWRRERAIEEVSLMEGFVTGSAHGDAEAYERGKAL